MAVSFERDLSRRLIRIESKLVRGFEELGVNIDGDTTWLTVDNSAKDVYVSTLGRSLIVTLSDMQRGGATHVGEMYNIVHKGNVVAQVLYNPVKLG